MIPGVIQASHVNTAMDEIDRNGILAGRASRKFFVTRGGKQYPPKYVISIAYKIATDGGELDSATFNGGAETNNFLRKLQFSIEQEDQKVIRLHRKVESQPLVVIGRSTTRSAGHSEQCAECKSRVLEMLKKLYPSTIRNAKVSVPTTPEGLDATPASQALREIYKALQSSRGFGSFVSRETLAR